MSDQRTDAHDGYQLPPDNRPSVPDDLANAIAPEVDRVQRIRTDMAEGRPVTRADEAWAAGVELDGYVNEVTGIGSYLKDKTFGGKAGGPDFIFHAFGWQEAEARTRGSDLGHRIVNVIPDEMTREGWDLQVQPTEEDQALAADPQIHAELSAEDPRAAAVGWRAQAKNMRSDAARARAFLYARRWDDFAASQQPNDPSAAQAFGAGAAPQQGKPSPPAPPPPGPLPKLNDEGIEISEAMEKRMEQLDLIGAVNKALRYERCFGGGAIFIGADDGVEDLTLPLDETKIRSIRHFTPYFGGWDGEITAWRWYVDPRKPKFGTPEVYMIRNLGVPISRTPAPGEGKPPPVYMPTGPGGGMVWYVHESRLVVFDGEPITRRSSVDMRGWGDSIYTRIDRRLSQFDQAWGGVAILLQELGITVVSIDGLADMLASNDARKKGAVIQRAQQLALSKSIANIVLLDSKEKYQRDSVTLSGASDILGQLLLVMAGVADMPVSLLVGQVKGGLGDAGSTDIRFFYDKIRSQLKRKLVPKLNRPYRLAWLAKDSPTKGVLPERWSLIPRELWQMSEVEKAGLRKTYADIDDINIRNGIYGAAEAAASRYGGSEFGTDIVLDLEGRARMAADPAPRPAPAPTPPPPDALPPEEKEKPAVAPSNSTSIGVTSPAAVPPMVAVPTDPITGDPSATPSPGPTQR